MNVNSLAKKSAIAAAIALASSSVFAADLDVAAPAVFANEIFGEQSERTTVRMPQVKFVAEADLQGKASQATDTIKLTLEGLAEFGERYDDPTNWGAQGVIVQVGGVELDATNASVVSGGTINDNQITIELTAAAGNLDEVTIEGMRVRNLKDTLERVEGTAVRSHNVAVEVRSVDGEFENTPEVPAFYSINGVQVDSDRTGYGALENDGSTTGRAWLQAGADYKYFTKPAGTALNSKNENAKEDLETQEIYLDLGTFNFKRGVLTLGGVDFEAGKETGAKFDFVGADEIFFTVESDQPLNSYPNLRLTTALTCDAATDANSTVLGGVAGLTRTVPATSINYNLDVSDPLRLCSTLPADGAANVLPEAGFKVGAVVDYFNSRYTNSEGQVQDFGRVLRNVAGCQVSLFNLPNPNAQDKAFIRFTNTSSGGAGMTGPVFATVWGQDGAQLGEKVQVVDSLAPHATVVLHTNAGQESGVYLGEKLTAFAESGGRSRIILEGEFSSCEAMGLVRSPADVLTNMTSTVYSGSANGTSNTRN